MRLTKQMKSDLFNVIKNKTTRPFGDTFKSKYKEELQKLINKQEPIFAKYYETYGYSYGVQYYLYFGVDNGRWSNGLRDHLLINLPAVDDQMKLLLDPEALEDHINRKEVIYTVCSETLNYFKDEYRPLLSEILEEFLKYEEYYRVLNELHDIIQTFSTDTALVQAYPEFEQYFIQAGITNKPKRALPSVTGLPNVLEKYGVKLSKDVDTLAEEIKQENNQDE